MIYHPELAAISTSICQPGYFLNVSTHPNLIHHIQSFLNPSELPNYEGDNFVFLRTSKAANFLPKGLPRKQPREVSGCTGHYGNGKLANISNYISLASGLR